jgi:hypothetical protein
MATNDTLSNLKRRIQLLGGAMAIEKADPAIKSALAGPDDRAVDKLEQRLKAQLDRDGIVWNPKSRG